MRQRGREKFRRHTREEGGACSPCTLYKNLTSASHAQRSRENRRKPTRLVVAEKGNNTRTTYGIAVAGLSPGSATVLSLLLVPASSPFDSIWNASRERNARSVTDGARRVMEEGKRGGKTTCRSWLKKLCGDLKRCAKSFLLFILTFFSIPLRAPLDRVSLVVRDFKIQRVTKSDQHQLSPNNISRSLRVKLMRMTKIKLINKGRRLWS